MLANDSKIVYASQIPNNVEKSLYLNILNIMALSIDDSPELRKNGENILIALADNLNTLHAKYLREIIENIEGLDSINSGDAESILLLNGYLRICGLQSCYLETMQNAIKTVMDNSQAEGIIRVLSAVALVSQIISLQNYM